MGNTALCPPPLEVCSAPGTELLFFFWSHLVGFCKLPRTYSRTRFLTQSYVPGCTEIQALAPPCSLNSRGAWVSWWLGSLGAALTRNAAG